MEYHKYSSETIVKHVNFFEVNKSHSVNLLKIMPEKKCTSLKLMYTQFPLEIICRLFQIPLKNDQGHRLSNTTT